MIRPPLFIDCPPFLDELRRGELGHLVPDLEVHVGDPDPATRSKLLEGRAIVMNDHSQFDRALMAACPDLKAIVFLVPGRMRSRPGPLPATWDDVEAVRVITAAIGLACTEVSVLESSISTQENMKQKKAATPMPALMLGRKMVVKKRGNE